ncbi:g1 s-specific cyclin-e1 [Stylonychia lemnae]|uniref:G1 s-specific cyclin-e1 n=1 Tax=Stylonychia lemnae TaxID=5949 RepID=A0A078A1B3_STYLE|nr:g1 s-specific cyclin-e1 [Stylonychia lemnae]|eukprot:CDW74569.1 g1 s-specific cyclin-e1 [Stylonychia lemnae]
MKGYPSLHKRTSRDEDSMVRNQENQEEEPPISRRQRMTQKSRSSEYEHEYIELDSTNSEATASIGGENIENQLECSENLSAEKTLQNFKFDRRMIPRRIALAEQEQIQQSHQIQAEQEISRSSQQQQYYLQYQQLYRRLFEIYQQNLKAIDDDQQYQYEDRFTCQETLANIYSSHELQSLIDQDKKVEYLQVSNQCQFLFKLSGLRPEGTDIRLPQEYPRRKDTLQADETLSPSLNNIYCTSNSNLRDQMMRQDSLFDSPNEKNEQLPGSTLKQYENLNKILINNLLFSQKLTQTYLEITSFQLIQNGKAFLNLKERVAISDWMALFCSQKEIHRQTYYLALSYFDVIVNNLCQQILRNQFNSQKDQTLLEGLAIVSLFLACKLEEVKPPSLMQMHQCIRSNTVQQLIEIERETLKILNFKLVNFTIYDYLIAYLKIWKDINLTKIMDLELECQENIDDLSFEDKIFTFVDLLLLDIQSSTFSAALLGLAVVYLGKQISGGLSLSCDVNEKKTLEQLSFNTLYTNGDNQINEIFELVIQQAFGDLSVIQHLQQPFQFLIKFAHILDRIIHSQDESLFVPCESQVKTMAYSKNWRPEITNVILDSLNKSLNQANHSV